jgi:hypothetical protein
MTEFTQEEKFEFKMQKIITGFLFVLKYVDKVCMAEVAGEE